MSNSSPDAAIGPPKEASPDTADVNRGMVLAQISVKNFRSLYDVSLPLRPDLTVIVGENNSGKSNVIDALRLSLSPDLGRRTRYFEPGDASFGREDQTVEIVTVFDQLTSTQVGLFATAVDLNDMTARFTTRFAIDPERPNRSRPATTVGPGNGPEIDPERREDLRHVYLEPLRDAQRELDSSTSRRLASIIESLYKPGEVDSFVADTNDQLRSIERHRVVAGTSEQVGERLLEMTEPVRAQAMGIKFSDYRLQRLALGLRFKMAESGIELADLTESGLGYANLLYIATVLLQLDRAVDAELTVVLVEEPEAHLHPQLQAVLLDYLREQAAASGGDTVARPAGRIQVIVTTHSPLIATSVPVDSVIVLRSSIVSEESDSDSLTDPLEISDEEREVGDAADSQVVSRTATVVVPIGSLELTPDEVRKLGQYLDATKAALLFGSKIVLVEGVSEAVLLPVIGRRVFSGTDLVSRRRRRGLAGLTIVNVGSVDFEPYVKLLLGRYNGISILDRLIVVTDSDPAIEVDTDDDVDAETEPVGEAVEDLPGVSPIATRIESLLALRADYPELKVFAADRTLEPDLLAVKANREVFSRVFLTVKPRSQRTLEAILKSADPAGELYQRMRRNRKFIAKGEFAHLIAISIADGSPFEPPDYLVGAIVEALG